jgi:hypothetical protein
LGQRDSAAAGRRNVIARLDVAGGLNARLARGFDFEFVVAFD